MGDKRLIAAGVLGGFIIVGVGVALFRMEGRHDDPGREEAPPPHSSGPAVVRSPLLERMGQQQPSVASVPRAPAEGVGAPGSAAAPVGAGSQAGLQGSAGAGARGPRGDGEGVEGTTTSTRTKTVWTADATGIRGAMRESLPELRECYEAWLETNPSIGGRVVVKFTVGPDEADPKKGKVIKAKIDDSSVGHLVMEGCVVSVIQDLAFDRPGGDGKLEVTYPLTFSSTDGGTP